MSITRRLTFLLLASVVIMGQGIDINGYVRNYLGVLTDGNYDYAINQNTLDLRFNHTAGNVAFYANPYLYQYPQQEMELGLRETYMDIYFDNMDLRIGKQQIIWGKADGVFITDIVSPKDLNEFLLRDFDEIRMGVTSLKADYYRGEQTLELVWIPTFTPTIMPDASSIWSRVPSFTLPVVIDDSRIEVPARLKNSEGFIKYSGMSSLLDFEVMAGIMWDDDPTLHITPIMEGEDPLPAALQLTPEHHRLTLAGGSFSSEWNGIIFRAEGAYYQGKKFMANNNTGLPTDLLEKDYLHYLIGTDLSVGSTWLSFQFIQRAIFNYKDVIVDDRLDNTVTFLANRTYLKDTLTLQLFGYVGLNHQDALIRPSLTYDFADGFEILAGANIFTGDADSSDPGLFGYYADNDMVYVKVKYSF
ncbi:MAG: hypothetical protein GXO91_09425 [FCB group bacterium]|nr:hypothetical protein [FCB group bacterium]